MKEKNSNNNSINLKELRKQEKLAHKQYVENKIENISNNQIEMEWEFKQAKKLRWYDYLIIIFISFFIIGISFIIGIFGFKDISKTEWITTAFSLLSGLCWLIIFWYKNRFVANFYNDKRRRYQTTLSEEEGHLRRISKITLFICIILTISSIIIWVIPK